MSLVCTKTNNRFVGQDILIYDLECSSSGNPDSETDIMKVFGAYSYRTDKYYVLPVNKREQINNILHAHKFLVGFNNIDYDNPILVRTGFLQKHKKSIYTFDGKFKCYKHIIDLRQIIKQRAGAMITKKGMLGNVLMKYSLDYITRFLDLVDDNSAKGDIDYSILDKNNWTKEEVEQIITYTKRDLEITKKLYEWLEDYFDSFKDFLGNEDVINKSYLIDTMAKFGYKADCHALGWEPEYNYDCPDIQEEDRISGGYVAFPADDIVRAKKVCELINEEKWEDLIIQLDFNSLYPFIMIQANLHSRNKNNVGWNGNHLFKTEGYYNTDSLSPMGKLIRKWYFLRLFYKRKLILENGKNIKMSNAIRFKGQKYYHVDERHGYFDMELLELTDERIRIFERLAESGVDLREYTIKILINLQYGLLNKPFYKLVYDSVAGADCTRLGRQWVKYARKVYKENGYPLMYTDSVSKNTKITLDNGKQISVEEYWNKYTKNIIVHDKETAYCTEPILICDDDFKNKLSLPKRIIRHKTKKKMYRIHISNTHNIEVTEDHSLITICPETQKLISIKPEEIKNVGYVLVNKKNIKETTTTLNYPKELYFLMGHVIGNGNLLKQQKSIKYNYISLSDKYIDVVIEKILKPLQQIYKFNISRKNKITDIVINSTELAELLFKLGFNGQSNNKKIPEFIFNETKENIIQFVKGYMSADGGVLYRNDKPIIRLSSINKDLINGMKRLFKILGYRVSTFQDNKKYICFGKQSKYNMQYLNVLDKYKYIKEIGFIYDIRKECEKIIDDEKWIGNNNIAKSPSPHIKKVNMLNLSNVKYNIEKDFHLVSIKKIESYYEDDYVYDFSIDNYERFYANDILVHNTDSWYFVDVFNDKKKYLDLKDKVIKDIKDSLPFPQPTFDADIDAEIKYMFFFKGKNEDKESDKEMDEDDFINKPKGLMKKNYIYVTLDDKIVIKNLGIKKKNISALSKEIFWKHLVPEIKSEGKIKFSKSYIKDLITKLLEENIELSFMRKEVKDISAYQKSKTGMQAQISEKYGKGIHFMIPNIRGVGVGKDIKYCTYDEFKNLNMKIYDIDLKPFWKELNYFIEEPKQYSLFNY